MVSLTSLLLNSWAVGVLASPLIVMGPAAPLPQPGDVIATATFSAELATPTATGTHGVCYYSFWSDGGGPVTYNNLDEGRYNVSWNGGNGNCVAGKGWNPGGAK